MSISEKFLARPRNPSKKKKSNILSFGQILENGLWKEIFSFLLTHNEDFYAKISPSLSVSLPIYISKYA